MEMPQFSGSGRHWRFPLNGPNEALALPHCVIEPAVSSIHSMGDFSGVNRQPGKAGITVLGIPTGSHNSTKIQVMALAYSVFGERLLSRQVIR